MVGESILQKLNYLLEIQAIHNLIQNRFEPCCLAPISSHPNFDLIFSSLFRLLFLSLTEFWVRAKSIVESLQMSGDRRPTRLR